MGIAKDKAFASIMRKTNAFYVRRDGTQPSSPPADTVPLIGIEALYWRGYPEVFARELSENAAMRENIRDFCRTGRRNIREMRRLHVSLHHA